MLAQSKRCSHGMILFCDTDGRTEAMLSILHSDTLSSSTESCEIVRGRGDTPISKYGTSCQTENCSECRVTGVERSLKILYFCYLMTHQFISDIYVYYWYSIKLYSYINTIFFIVLGNLPGILISITINNVKKNCLNNYIEIVSFMKVSNSDFFYLFEHFSQLVPF